jgi:hypothetical protein
MDKMPSYRTSSNETDKWLQKKESQSKLLAVDNCRSSIVVLLIHIHI